MGSFLARPRHRLAVSCTAFLVAAAPLAAAVDVLVPPGDSLPVVLEAPVDPAGDAQHHVRIEGKVRLPDGGPACGAVVVSSAGGSAAVREDGSFALELAVAPEVLAVEVTAVANGRGGNLIARRQVYGLRDGTSRDAGTLFLAQSAGCVQDWIPTFGGAPGMNEDVRVLAVFDDGSGAGPALYAAGEFTIAGGQSANWIAKWDGQSWSALGSEVNSAVNALTVFDDGSGGGPALYAGGWFTSAGGQPANRIAKWDGQAWSALGSEVNSVVNALTVFDDGSGGGPALYAGGLFTQAGGQFVGHIAKWDGQSWSSLGPVGSGVNGVVNSMTVLDDGSGAGPALYVGGLFTIAEGLTANRIARWDGQNWSTLGSGLNNSVYVVGVYDDGSGAGPALYVGGGFTSAGGQSANKIAKWDGQAWSPLSSGVNGEVYALSVYDDGSGAGPALYVGGSLSSAGGQTVNRIARWDGQTWSPVGGGVSGRVYALSAFDDGAGAGPALCVGGEFQSAGGLTVYRIAKWDGQSWGVMGSGINGRVTALAVFDDGLGAGPALYAAGSFTQAGGQSLNRIAKWDGESWSPLLSGVNSDVNTLSVFDDGSGAGPALYAAGWFTSASGQSTSRIAKWNGQSWSALGTGLNSTVEVLTVFDDGSGAGPALYAGGGFTSAGGQSANRIAKWDGQTWSALGSGIDGSVRALTGFDDGSGAGPALYAGGFFASAGGQSASKIAKWDGGQGWSALSSGMDDWVLALTVYDDGSGAGPALYAGGQFTSAGGQSASHIAKWNGQSWSALASEVNHHVSALTVFDDGSGAGPALYAGGDFTSAGGLSASRIAKWDGQSWGALSSGMDDYVFALIAFDDGSGAGPALYAGGDFDLSPGGDGRLAKWGCQAIDTLPGCFGNPAALASLSSKPAIGSTLSVSLSSSQLATGLGLLFFGLDGTDAAGCGLFVPGYGELLLGLAPMPLQVGSGPLSAGAVGFALPVPDEPALVGVEIALQGVVLGLFDPGLPIELSSALRVTITQ